MMIRTFTFCLLTLAASFPAAAACDCYNLFEVVPGHPDKTWRDLAKAIVPDLNDSGVGNKVIEMRFVEDLGDADADPVPELPVQFYTVEAKTIEAEGRTLTVMLADLGQADGWATHFVPLALFDENLKLLDAINIGQDQMTALRGEPIRISKDSEALLSYSEHFNSNQTYGNYALIMVKDGRLETIDAISLLSDRWCGHERTQSLDVASVDAGPGYWPITVTVADVLITDGQGECGEDAADEEPFKNLVSATYNWSASMGFYVADREALDQLAEVNQARY